MSKKRKRALWMMVVMTVLSGGVLAFTSTRRVVLSSLTTKRTTPAQNPIAAPNGKSEDYVRSSRLWPQLRWNLKAFGDRLEKPGKERLTMTGTLAHARVTQAVILILEFPDHLRIEAGNIGPHQITTFNGKAAAKVGGPLDQSEQDLIETLVNDTAEHFFAGQMEGRATRCLGRRFRADDGATPNYTGPYYDLYEVSDQINSATDTRIQSKTFYFDSNGLLLQKVRYQILRNGVPVEVETRISDWQPAQGQQIPRRVVRLENDQPVMALTITALAMSP